MQHQRLGRSPIVVSKICMGTMTFGSQADEKTSFRILDRSLEAGINFFDTAENYPVPPQESWAGLTEEIFGRWMKTKRRDEIILATKVCGPSHGWIKGSQRAGMTALDRHNITRAIEDSLRRLGTDYIDLYQSHQDDRSVPLEETLGTYADLVKAGKVRHIGASNYTAARLAEALDLSRRHRLPAYVSLQPEYNLCKRAGYEAELEPLCRKRNVGVIGFYSLASGFLSGKYRTEADTTRGARGSRVAAYLNARGLRILAALDEVAARHHANPTRVAIAWLIARPGITAPIASATSLDQLHDLVEATRLTLHQDDIALLDRASGGEATPA